MKTEELIEQFLEDNKGDDSAPKIAPPVDAAHPSGPSVADPSGLGAEHQPKPSDDLEFGAAIIPGSEPDPNAPTPPGEDFDIENYTKGRFKSYQEFEDAYNQVYLTDSILNAVVTKASETDGVFASDEVKSFNQYKKSGGVLGMNMFDQIAGLDIQKSNPVDLLTMAKLVANPDLIHLANDIRDDYANRFEKDGDDYSDAPGDNLKRTMEISEARKIIQAEKDKMKSEDGKSAPGGLSDFIKNFTEKKDSLRQQWATPVQGLVAHTQKEGIRIPVSTAVGQEASFVLPLKLSAKHLQTMTDEMMSELVINDSELTKENLSLAYSNALTNFVARNIDAIIANAVAQALAQEKAGTLKRKHNPLSSREAPKGSAKPTGGDPKDAAWAALQGAGIVK
jgi:hypothetical protein